MKRKIIQLVAAGAGQEKRVTLCALCDDHTSWLLTDAGWQQLPEIPDAV